MRPQLFNEWYARSIFAGTSRPVVYINPLLSVETRWYYNQDRRIRKGKSLNGNNGFFLAAGVSGRYGTFSLVRENSQFIPNSMLDVYTKWGFRRAYDNGLILGYSLSVIQEFYFPDFDRGLYLRPQLKIGYQFSY